MNRIFLGLGSNLGDKEKNLISAKDLLMKNDVLVVGQSTLLCTKPLYDLPQPDYLNQVVEVTTELSLMELLFVCKKIEKEMGRDVVLPTLSNVNFLSSSTKKSKKVVSQNKSRIIDVDILFYGETVIDTDILTVPHSGILKRDFVISALKELAPDFLHPVLKKPLKALTVQS